MTKVSKDRFIPGTMARPIGDGVFFRPVRSWHSATYAGEKLTHMPGGTDRSGCMREAEFMGQQVCGVPLTVTHRLYWHERNPEKTISAFLSYPDGMDCCSEYFWEALGVDEEGREYEDVTRWTGDDAEDKMETAIKTYLLTTAILTN